MKSYTLKLRPHHLLCLQKYTGHGYNETFTSQMNDVIHILQKDPDTKIELVKGRDLLCCACPNDHESICQSEEKVCFMDEKVIQICQMYYGETGPWSRLSKEAAGIFLPGVFDTVCGACEWNQLCKDTKGGILYEQE